MSESGGRTVLRGIPAAQGVSVGPVRVVTRLQVRVPRRRLVESEVRGEVERLRRAIAASRAEIEEARSGLAGGDGGDFRLVLDAHLLMHSDELIVDAAVRAIESELMNSEWALHRTVEGLRAQLAEAKSEYFRDRAEDVAHVGKHILRWLTGTPSLMPPLDAPVVLVADELSPAEAARLADRPVLGLVTELGSATSHTAILARTLGIPALVGVTGATDAVDDGDIVVLDALRGELVLHTSSEERARAEERSASYQRFNAELRVASKEAPATADGTRVHLYANLEIPAEAELARSAESDGVGLYRTELLYLDRDRAPTEEEQLAVYSHVVRAMAPRPVTFRTFDLGGDKLPAGSRLAKSPNPALGLRAVRLLLARPDLFRAQVRAILRSAADGEARLMFPLVATLGELRAARAMVTSARDELAREGVPFADVAVGAMIEVPSAALVADALAKECDFFSVGTNDLVQYALALDRSDPRVASLARPLDPAVLRLLDMTARAAERAGIGLSMCGDMASDPVALPLLVGLGYTHLSMPSASLPLARAVLARVRDEEARALARDALLCDDADAVRALVIGRFGAVLGDLWSPRGGEG